VKRRILVRQLEQANCVLKRSSGKHDIYFNPSTERSAPVPRHAEIPDTLCRLILKQLGLERSGEANPQV
jgi:predicted RNA binding protein YcfA (HicA-like mRNA interferase family)